MDWHLPMNKSTPLGPLQCVLRSGRTGW